MHRKTHYTLHGKLYVNKRYDEYKIKEEGSYWEKQQRTRHS